MVGHWQSKEMTTITDTCTFEIGQGSKKNMNMIRVMIWMMMMMMMTRPTHLKWLNISVVVGVTFLLDRATSFHSPITTVTRIQPFKSTPTTIKGVIISASKSTTTSIINKDNDDNFSSSLSSLSATMSPFDAIWKSIEKTRIFQAPDRNTSNIKNRWSTPTTSPGTAFLQAMANCDIDEAMTYLDNSVKWVDTAYPSPLNRSQLERCLRLQAQRLSSQRQYSNAAESTLRWLIIENDIYDPVTGKAGVIFRQHNQQKCVAFFELSKDNSFIQKAFFFQEHQKQGGI
jgi:hypothetical protein